MRRSSVRLRSGRESTTGGPSVHLNIDNSAAGNRQSLLLFNEQGSYCKPSSTGPIPERNRCHHQDPIVHCCPCATRRCLTHLLTLVLVCRRSRSTSNLTAWSQSATAESSWGQRSQVISANVFNQQRCVTWDSSQRCVGDMAGSACAVKARLTCSAGITSLRKRKATPGREQTRHPISAGSESTRRPEQRAARRRRSAGQKRGRGLREP